jgi:transglutaminase-like putative cysteine protease
MPLSQVQTLWLLFAAGAAIAPLVPRLPIWLTAAAVLLLAWRAALWQRRAPLPARWLRVFCAVTSIAGILLVYRSIFGREPGVALLVLFLALKVLEARTGRDALAVIFLGYFLQITVFFDSQSPAVAVVAIAALVIVTTSLMLVSRDSQSWRSAMRRAALMLVQALPFMLVLFVLFPRAQGPLWGMPLDAYGAHTGLSDTMSPGSISQLSLSAETAFRVKFDGRTPPKEKLYWRGPVLTRFDGRTWRAAPQRLATSLPYVPTGAASDYTVTLEPHDKNWQFALDLPGSVPPNAAIGDTFQLLAHSPIRGRIRYAMRSYLDLTAGQDEAPAGLREALALPAGLAPKARALAQEWRARDAAPKAVAAMALAYFRQQPFVYTLSPPLLGDNAIDEFLFETRRGFCEHYAAAFVFLMRAADIPARVVTGYQGGETNPVDDYLVVRQSDAHAWAELWVQQQGWVRVDPTSAVAPSRIEQGLAFAVPAGEPVPSLLRARFGWLRTLRFRWEAAGNAWDQWVLGYNPQRQRELLTRLGMRDPDWHSMAVAMSVATGIIMLGLAAWAMRQRRRRDPLVRLWEKLSHKFESDGLGRQAWEGPTSYARRIAAAKPHLGTQIAEIAGLYAQLRYGLADPQHLRELALRIRRLRP